MHDHTTFCGACEGDSYAAVSPTRCPSSLYTQEFKHMNIKFVYIVVCIGPLSSIMEYSCCQGWRHRLETQIRKELSVSIVCNEGRCGEGVYVLGRFLL